jgi:hypothetical protein
MKTQGIYMSASALTFIAISCSSAPAEWHRALQLDRLERKTLLQE